MFAPPSPARRDSANSPSGLAKPAIVGFALAIVGLMWFVALQQMRFEREQAIAAVIRQNENRVVAFEQYVMRTLEAARVTMDHIKEKYAPDGTLVGIDKSSGAPHLIDDTVARNRIFTLVSIVDARGDLVASTFDRIPAGVNVARHPVFRETMRHRGTGIYVSPPSYSRVVGRDHIYLADRILREDGRVAGVVTVQIEPAEFINFARDASFSPTDMISIIGLDGVTRARRTGDRTSFGENLAGTLVMQMQMRQPNGTYLGPSSLDGVPRYFSHRRLQGYPLFVTSGTTGDAFLAPIVDRKRAYFAGLVIATIAISLAAGLLIIGIDRRRRQIEEIAAANERLHEAQRVGAMGDWGYDRATDRLRWSANLCAMYERDPARAVSPLSDVDAYVSSEEAGFARAALDRVMATGEKAERLVPVILPSGATGFHRFVAVATRDHDGNTVGVHGTAQDVTARVRLKDLEAKLAHLSRVDAMNAMASTLAHELNQPLAAAANYLAAGKRLLARSDCGEKRAIGESLAMSEAQVLTAGSIIRSVREMVSGKVSGKTVVRIGSLLDDTFKFIRNMNQGKPLSLGKALADNADTVFAVPVQIQQVIVNLVTNAIEATPEGRYPKIMVKSERAREDWVVVSVEDNGAGTNCAPGELFSTSFTTKETGLGLGLSVSRTIVEAHGGKIWLEKSGSDGSTICFTLPARPLDE